MLKRSGTRAVAQRSCALLLCATALAGPARRSLLWAQEPVRSQPSQLLFWGVNVGVGTLAALVQGRPVGASLPRAIVGGIAGGTLMYAGQRIVATRRPALRLAGLETVAVGASVTRNIARKAAPFSDVTLPLFPFYVRVRSGDQAPRLSVRLSAVAAVSSVQMATRTGRRFNFLESLYSGAAVFSRPGGAPPCIGLGSDTCAERVGEHRFGAVTCAAGVDCGPYEVISHELEHVAQDVRDAVLFAIPASDYLFDHMGNAGHWISRYFVADLFLPLMVTNRIIDPTRVSAGCRSHVNFYECETEALLGR